MNTFDLPENPEEPKPIEPTDGPGPPDQTGESGDLGKLILEILENSGELETAEEETESNEEANEEIPETPEGSEESGGSEDAPNDPQGPEEGKKRKKRKKSKKKDGSDESDTPETSESPKKAEKPKRSAWKALVKFLIKLAVVALLFWIALTYVFGVFRLVGNGMYPMLKDGDLCITYRLDPYYSQDVVAYRVGEEIHFGRIVARVGDTVNGDSTGLVINGGHPTEEIFYATQMLDTNLDLPVRLGEGEFVILNDHREDLEDSRTYGVIREEDLEGKVVFLFRRRSI